MRAVILTVILAVTLRQGASVWGEPPPDSVLVKMLVLNVSMLVKIYSKALRIAAKGAYRASYRRNCGVGWRRSEAPSRLQGPPTQSVG